MPPKSVEQHAKQASDLPEKQFEFDRLSDIVYIRRPRNLEVDPEAPQFVLLFAFYNAPMHTLHKDYIKKYSEKWPSASIIVVQGVVSWLFKSQSEKDSLLNPLVRLLIKDVYEPLEETGCSRGLLVQVMSNGGGFMYASFADLLERTLVLKLGNPNHALKNKDRCIPLAILLDSIPSVGSSTGSAFVTGIKSPVMKAAAFIPATIFMSAVLGAYRLLGVPQPYAAMNARLLSEDVFPFLSDYSTPRLYVFSEGDEVVDCREVEAHLNQLREAMESVQSNGLELGLDGKSTPILVERFGPESIHVMHVRADPERYWDAVNRLWQKTLDERCILPGQILPVIKPKL